MTLKTGKQRTRKPRVGREEKDAKVRIGPLRQGSLKQFGYGPKERPTARKRALREAVNKYGKDKVIRKLNAVSVLTKRKQPGHSQTYKTDMHYVERMK